MIKCAMYFAGRSDDSLIFDFMINCARIWGGDLDAVDAN